MFKISARNQITGTVLAVKEGAVNGVVTIDLGNALLKADVTMSSIHELGIREGSRVSAAVKATDVIFGVGTAPYAISAGNQFPGVVSSIKTGAVNGSVGMRAFAGFCVSGTFSNEDIEDLGLVEGLEVVAIIKSGDVLLGNAD